MRIKQTPIYAFSELTEAQQEKAHSNYINSGHFEYSWLDEGLASVKAYVEHFGGKVKNWELGTSSYSHIDIELPNPHGIKPVCPEFLTGYCIDETFRIAFETSAKPSGDVRGAVMDAVEACVKDIVADMESQETLEYFADMAEANGWEFDENGNFA